MAKRKSKKATAGLAVLVRVVEEETAALRALQTALDSRVLDDEKIDALHAIGIAFSAGDAPEQAHIVFRALTTLRPTEPGFLASVSGAAIALGYYDEVVSAATKALELSEDDSLARFNRGRAHWFLGDKAEGDRDLQAVADAVDSEFAPSARRLLTELAADPDGIAALAERRADKKSSPGPGDLVRLDALLATLLANQEQALAQLREGGTDGTWVEKLEWTGLLEHLQRLDLAEGREAYGALIALDPERPQWVHQLAQFLIAAGDDKGCIKACDQALKMTPTDPMLYAMRGTARLRLGQLDGVMSDLKEIRKRDAKGVTEAHAIGQSLAQAILQMTNQG